MSGAVQLLGRVHNEPLHARRRQASEKRQGTKSREADRRRCGGLWGIRLEGHRHDGRICGEQLAGPSGGRVVGGLWRVRKEVRGLLGGCLGGE